MLLTACIHTRHTWFTTNGGDNDDNYNIILCQPTMVAESVPQLNRRQQGLSLSLSPAIRLIDLQDAFLLSSFPTLYRPVNEANID